MENNKNRNRIILISLLVIILVSITIGITYAFFNYTRTGLANNIGTGRIYFNTSQNGRLQLSNIFPVKSSDVNANTLDSVTVGIVGDTTYEDGEEFQITLVDVQNTVNGKQIPINYIATYTANTDAVIGTSSNDYWNARESKDANIYLLNGTGAVEEDKQVLVGYIDNGQAGINGTLTIKAYVDADRIAISDTYPESDVSYKLNTNMTQEEINTCVNYLQTTLYFSSLSLLEGETVENYCNGTGTAENYTFQADLNANIYKSAELDYFVEHNIVQKNHYSNGTTDEWANGRTVLTTEEWNSLQNTPISFKIRAESNEGIWVKNPIPTMEEMCPGCKFAFVTTPSNTTWNTYSATPTVIDSSNLKDSYEEVVEENEENFFLGVITNENNQIERAFTCGLKDGTIPFCIEGTSDGSKYNENKKILQGANLYNNSCYENVQYSYTSCESSGSNTLSVQITYSGSVSIEIHGDSKGCRVSSDGEAYCSIGD